MSIRNNYLLACILICFVFSISACDTLIKPKPPIAEQIKKELTLKGKTRIDNYYWLKDRDDPNVIKYLEAENNYLNRMMKHTQKLQDELYNEMIGRIKQQDESVPYLENGYWYYYRYEKGKEYKIYCRKKATMDASEEILLDVNKLAEGKEYLEVNSLQISPDNKIMAYSVDTVSRRLYFIYFKNLETGNLIGNPIPFTNGFSTWANDNKTIFYTHKDTGSLRSYLVMKHILGSDPSLDIPVYKETDSTFSAGAFKSKTKKFIFITSFSTLSTEYRYIDADKPDADFKVFYPRQKELEYYVFDYENDFYIQTNYKAKNYRLMSCPVNNTSIKNWKEIIPHRNDVVLNDIEVFKNYLAIEERKNGLKQIRIINWKDHSDYYIDFGEAAYESEFGENPEFNSDVLRYEYSSLTTPYSVYDFNMVTKEKVLKKQLEVLGGFNSANYESKRVFAKTNDSAMIPISLVYRKGIKLDGNNPLILYGYGSYGYVLDPYFSSSRLSVLDRNFIFAIAHIRGGADYGKDWYDNGRTKHKINTFTDFISCAEYLIDAKYTIKDKLCIMGGSAGGLLIGAVINLRPDLFKAAIAQVPFVDVLTTMLDESIPLTTGEFDEWGNPKDTVYYNYILSYSPYDNVKAQNYPALLVTTGLHDSQVQYWEPAKWVAKIRTLKTDNNLLLLYTDMATGHGGASGRFEQYKETAMEYAFFIDQVGLIKK